ncbi:MAG: phosphodiester glycosidase family protein, partial [Spirochaetales bacterium]|nr:phosphodiester glycosidase family protein [Spirochaetales bacterium]
TDVSIVAVGDDMGYLSAVAPRPKLVFNSHFFIFDLTDNDSPYDVLGTPFGIVVKDGVVSQPPLNGREALLVDRHGKVEISRPALENMTIGIQGFAFRHGENCTVYRRPGTRVTPEEEGLDLVIVGDRVVAMHQGGQVRVPMAGFVLHTQKALDMCPSPVVFHGFEDCIFGIQVGSSAVKDGVVAQGFESPFYDIRDRESVPFPPTLYPLDYARSRAPRMALCSDASGKPAIIWAEGPSKLFYRKGEESCGASLLELGEYCRSIGMVNALNLDGGGSAEIFLEGRLSMHVSDRYMDNSDAERPVPMGLMVR